VGKNYLDHVREIHVKNTASNSDPVGASAVHVDTPKYAQFFTKAPECVVAPGEGVPAHANLTRWLDYEVELAVIVGKQGVNISRADALNHVFGWTIGNDITARDVQKRHTQFFKGKTLDGTCPLGPCIVPKEDLDASDLSLKLWVNGDLRQNGRTSDMIFDVPAIIEQLSAGFTLYPGDVILTGTPSGVGYAMNPPQALKSGDVVRLEIEGIGSLENTIV
jgi:2-keto-4-pentenoate hydratase/2-oxohepta-3-ene-1,7-dioic acid hydratase in catechol pathway